MCDEIAGRYGYETLKQILGHELVHVGQFTRHAELSRRRDDLLRRGLRMHPPQTSDEFSEDMLSMAAANWRRGMTFLEATVEHRRQAEALEEEMFLLEANLESYARSIERDFLGKRSVCDHIPSPPSVFDWVRERLGESRETPAAAASAEAPPGAGASPPGEPAMEPVLSTEQMAVMPLPAGSGTFVTMGIVDLTPPSVTVVVAPLVGTTHVEMVPLSGPGEADEEPLPLELMLPAFRDVWADWCLHRAELYRANPAKRWTALAARKTLTECARHGAELSAMAITAAISNGWQGLVWDRLQYSPTHSPNGQHRTTNRPALTRNAEPLLAGQPSLNTSGNCGGGRAGTVSGVPAPPRPSLDENGEECW